MSQPLHLPAEQLNAALAEPKVEVMNFLNQVALRFPQAISFAPGRPPETCFDVAAALPCIGSFLRAGDTKQLHRADHYGIDALGQYGRTNGVIGALIARLLRNDEQIEVEPEDIVVTVGAQEAMCLCLNVLCGNPGDVALTIEPAYIGFSAAARILGVEVVGVPAGGVGIDFEALQATVHDLAGRGKRARLLYLSSDHANPTGITLPAGARARLLQAAQELDLLIVEDAAYNYFCYDGEPLPALKAMAGSERVIFLGSFSKSIFPGVRLGFIAAGQRVRLADGSLVRLADEISKAKSLFTVNTSPLMQALVGGLLIEHDCSLREYVRPRVQRLKANRDTMLAALASHLPWPSPISWNRPAGGFFLTLTLPHSVGNEDLLACAGDHGVTWTPMAYFDLGSMPSNQIRLSFSYVTPLEIADGVERLAAWLRQWMAARPERLPALSP